MKTMKIKQTANSVNIILHNNNITTVLNINNQFIDKITNIISNCKLIGYIEI